MRGRTHLGNHRPRLFDPTTQDGHAPQLYRPAILNTTADPLTYQGGVGFAPNLAESSARVDKAHAEPTKADRVANIKAKVHAAALARDREDDAAEAAAEAREDEREAIKAQAQKRKRGSHERY
jgi:hypothetical protein